MSILQNLFLILKADLEGEETSRIAKTELGNLEQTVKVQSFIRVFAGGLKKKNQKRLSGSEMSTNQISLLTIICK